MMQQPHGGFNATGPITLKDGAGQYLRLPRLTAEERDSLEPSDGMEIFNTDTGQREIYGNEEWGAAVQSNTPGDVTKIRNIYLKEEDEEVVIIT